MSSESPAVAVQTTPANSLTGADVVAILRERGWLAAGGESEAGSPLQLWVTRASEILGPHAADRAALGELLSLIFSYGMFHPIRLALTGRAGEGDLDRVILLLDAAAKLDFAAPVKGTRVRMLEFCAALD